MQRVLLCTQNHPYRDYASITNRTLAAWLVQQAPPGLLDVAVADFPGELPVEAMVARILSDPPDVLGLSIYIWNYRAQYALIERLTAERPEMQIVIGGPHLAYDADDLAKLRARLPGVALIVQGEGERALLDYLSTPAADRPAAGTVVMGKALESLAQLPGPVFEAFPPETLPGFYLLETTRGCSNGCAYCMFSGFGPLRRHKTREQLSAELADACARGIGSVIHCEPSMNLSDEHFERMHAVLHDSGTATRMTHEVMLDYLRLTDRQVAALSEINAHITLGLQTVTPEVARRAHRPLNLGRFKQAVSQLKATGRELAVDVILGLPGETLDSFTRTLDELAGLDVDARIYTLRILPGTELYRKRKQLGIEIDWDNGHLARSTPDMSAGDFSAARTRIAERGHLLAEDLLDSQQAREPLRPPKTATQTEAAHNAADKRAAAAEIERLFRQSRQALRNLPATARIRSRHAKNLGGHPALVIEMDADGEVVTLAFVGNAYRGRAIVDGADCRIVALSSEQSLHSDTARRIIEALASTLR